MTGTAPRPDVGVLLEAHAELRRATQVEDLFAAAARLAGPACGFARCLVASVADGRLSAAGSLPLAAPDADALRRLLLAHPLPLHPGTEEAEHVRHGRRPRPGRRPRELAAHLGLAEHALGTITPDHAVLAVLVLDRDAPAVGPEDLERVDAFAGLVAVALDDLLLRRRVADLAREIRQFALVGQALAREALEAPPAFLDEGAPDPHAGVLQDPRARTAVVAYGRLSDKERAVARLLAEGRSNREIAGVLTVSPETVKSHVASILKRLGVTNRVEAARILMTHGEDRPASWTL